METQGSLNDKARLRYLRSKIDYFDFGVIRRYLTIPESGIKYAYVIDASVPLEEAAAIAWTGNTQRWNELVSSGIVSPLTGDIADDWVCCFLCVASACFVQLAGHQSI